MSTRKVCDATGKVSFTSVKAARDSLVGQLASKRMRAYECTADGSFHYHLTKERRTRNTADGWRTQTRTRKNHDSGPQH